MTAENHDTQAPSQPGRITLYALAMVGGLGITMMIVSAMFGVIGGTNLDASTTNLIGLSLIAGLLLLITAIGFWLGLVRPFERFDDINVPLEPEPHH